MSETLFQQQLSEMDACSEARNWVGDRHAGKAWRECERGDWMLWLAAKCGVDRKLVVLAACACARTALKFVPEGEARPLAAIETAERWARGDASVSLGDVRTAASAAADAADAAYAYADAADAADAAYVAAYAAAAAYVAAAAYAAVGRTARLTTLKVCSRLIRQLIPFPVLKTAYANRKK